MFKTSDRVSECVCERDRYIEREGGGGGGGEKCDIPDTALYLSIFIVVLDFRCSSYNKPAFVPYSRTVYILFCKINIINAAAATTAETAVDSVATKITLTVTTAVSYYHFY